jgi:hypothetical protein
LEADRIATRRLRAMAALDADFAQVVYGRDEWRRKGLTVLVGRLLGADDAPSAECDTLINDPFTLLSFEFFDVLAGPERSPDDVAPEVRRLARAALTLGASESRGAAGASVV